jgi:uncharacterized protein
MRLRSLIFGSLALTAISLGPVSAWSVQPTDVPAGQPADEAALQKSLPQVRDAIWSKLVKSKLSYDEENGTYGIKLTPEIKALGGKSLTLRGFILPMDGSDRTRHFLLSRNTPVCMYCPPGQPNEIVEVYSSRAIAWTEKIVAVTGKLDLVNDTERAIFFKMENAEVK